MKKYLLITVFVLCTATLVFGALNPFTQSIDTRRDVRNTYAWSGHRTKDKAWIWAKEVEDRLAGNTGNNLFFWTPTDTTPTTASKGMMYYDLSENLPKWYNGSAWVAAGNATSGNSLDTAYDIGHAITVDGTEVTLTVTDEANNSALKIDNNEATNDNDAMLIQQSGAGDALQIEPQETDSGGINMVAKAAGTVPLVILDGSTNNIDLADNKGQLLIQCDDPYIHAGASGLVILDSSTPIDAAEGFVARFIHSGTAKASTSAVEIEVPATQTALTANGQVVLTGQAASGKTTLSIVGNDGTGNTDALDVHNEGTGDCIIVTPDDVDTGGINVVAKASGTVPLLILDGSTNNIDLADEKGQLLIQCDDPYIHAGATGLMILDSSTPINAAEGFLARFVHSGTAKASTYAVEIEVPATQTALASNGQVIFTGQAASNKTTLNVVGNDGTNNTDALDVHNEGTGDCIQVTPDDVDTVGINVVGKASGTVTMLKLDGATNNWDGADNIGQITLTQDDAMIHGGASQLVCHQTGTVKAAAEGFCARFIQDTGAAVTDAYAVEIETTATTPCLKTNGQVTIAGQGATDGVLLDITSADTDDDTVQLTGVGSADVLQITSNATTSIGLNVVAKASGTTSDVIIDGTAGWSGADDVGLVHIKSDSALANNGATLLMVRNDTGQVKDGAEGYLARFVDSGAARTGSFAVEIETANTGPALYLNNMLKIDGADSTGVLLTIDNEDTTGDSDSIVATHDGDGDFCQVTLEAPASVGFNIIGDAAGTHPAINVDLETGAWVGAATTGAIEVTNDGLLVADASLLRLENKGKIAVANDGACLEVIDSGAATATSYAVRIASTSNEALHVDTGLVVIDEGLTIGTTLGVTGDATISGSITGDGGDEFTGYLLEVEVETGNAEQVLVADSGQIFANTDGQGKTTFTLPDAAAGLWYIFADNSATGADDLAISPQAGDKIDGDTAGDDIQSASDDSGVCLIFAVDGVNWRTIQGEAGTWTAD